MKEKDIDNYKIIKRVYYDGKVDYAVMKYCRPWYSRKYRWKLMQQQFGDEHGTWKDEAVFRTEEDAYIFILEQINHIVKEEEVNNYFNFKNKQDD